MITHTIKIDIAHPDPHLYNIVAFRIKSSEASGGPYTQIGSDWVFDPNTVPEGNPLNVYATQFDIEVPYGPYNTYFIAVAVDDQDAESDISNELLYTFNDTFAPPVITKNLG